jgi:ribosomal protein S18 acetylase RimI-like enzyme
MNLAPNGKPSNLTPEQYRLVRTPAFKAWFGDWAKAYETGNYDNVSKVIDEVTKEPKVVYHGSDKKFYTFNMSLTGERHKTIRRDSSVYFSDKEIVAMNYITDWQIRESGQEGGYIYPCFLSFRDKVRIIDGRGGYIGIENETISETAKDTDLILNNVINVPKYYKEIPSNIYVTSNPNSIKLADKIYKPIVNESGVYKSKTIGKINTTFDSNNTDIRYKDGGEITSFKKGDNLVVLKYIDGDNELGHVDYYFDTNGINSEGLDDEPFNFNSEIYIDFIEVEKEHRGKGIAKKLLNRVIEDAKQLGIEVITLRRDSGMGCSYGGGYDDYLKKLYSSVGFVETWTQEDYDKSGGAKNLCAMHLDVNENKLKKGGSIRKPKKRTISQTPAPKKDRIYGSKINKPKSSESKSKASSIILSPSVIKSIRTIINKHNEEYPNKKVPLSSAKAVVRRGMGAYSSTHRPTISGGKPNSRVAWGLARLNAFIYKIKKGKSKSGKYKQDDDLINELGYKVKPYAFGGQITDEQKETYKKWKELVNMSRSELEKFYNSEEGKIAGLSAKEAKEQGIDSGRESARWIMKMKYVPVSEWNKNMWRWAKKQISFISRMSGMKGKLYDEKGRKTRKHLALLIWGHNPEK